MRTSDGFTLLEVLVALAILGVAVVASIQGFAQGLRLLKLSGDHQYAMLLADRAARETLDPVEGRADCETSEGFKCERITRVLEAPEQAEDGRTPRFRVFEIAVRVSWDEHRQVEVTTLRTVAISPDGTTLTSRTPVSQSGATAVLGVPPATGTGSAPATSTPSMTPPLRSPMAPGTSGSTPMSPLGPRR